MQFVKGMVVRSKAGHDKGSFFVAVKTENDFAYIIDGKSRTLENPKKKKQKHLSPTSTVLCEQSMETDSEIQKVLAEFNGKVRYFI